MASLALHKSLKNTPPLSPSLQAHFPEPLQHYSLPVFQMSPDFFFYFHPQFSCHSLFSSPELSPAPGPDSPRHSNHSFIYTAQLLCSSVSSYMLASLVFLASCFCFRASVISMFTKTCTCLPACTPSLTNHWNHPAALLHPQPTDSPHRLPVLDVISVLIFSSNSRQEEQIFDAYFPKCIYIFPFEEARAPLRWIKAAQHRFCLYQKFIRIKFKTRLPFRCFIKVGISRFKAFAHYIFYVNVMSWHRVNTGKVNVLNLKYPRISKELVTAQQRKSPFEQLLLPHISIFIHNLGEVNHTGAKRWKTRVASLNCVVFQHGWWANTF